MEHNVNFMFAYAQIFPHETPDECWKPHAAESRHAGIHKMHMYTHLTNLPVTSITVPISIRLHTALHPLPHGNSQATIFLRSTSPTKLQDCIYYSNYLFSKSFNMCKTMLPL